MTMNFGSVANISTSASGSYLRPWNIYKDVKLTGILGPVSGNTKDGGTWRAWDFQFSSPSGSYKERIFEPNDKATERRTIKNANGHESLMPSDFERTLYFAAQLVDAFRPEKKDKFQAACAKITTFDQFIELLHKVLDGSENTAELLLVGRATKNPDGSETIYARLPNFVAINRNSEEAYTSERFVGHNLAMTPYELGKQKEFISNKPTNMDSVEGKDSPAKSDEQISDFNDLL